MHSRSEFFAHRGLRLRSVKHCLQYRIFSQVPVAYKMLTNSISRCWCLDILIYIVASAFVYFAAEGYFKGHRQGFFCDDRSLHFAYQNDTVTLNYLLACSLGLPLGIMICAEGFTKHAFDFWMGFLFTGVITEAGKLWTGELRPHFWDSCKPEVNSTMCARGYVATYTCNATAQQIIHQEPFSSFPSGHASISVYGMTFLVLYLQQRMPITAVSFLFRPTLQVGCVLWAVFCSISRVTDHRHHSWDVVAGSILGVTVGVLAARYRSIKSSKTHNQDLSEDNKSLSQIELAVVVPKNMKS